MQTVGLRTFVPLVAACPGCGRTTSTTFQELASSIQSFIRDSMPEWKTRYPGVEGLNVAVMGCIVNGPGESKHADIGISLPGTGEQPTAPVFIDGKKAMTLRGPTVSADFQKIVIDYIERRFGTGGGRANRGGIAAGRQRHAHRFSRVNSAAALFSSRSHPGLGLGINGCQINTAAENYGLAHSQPSTVHRLIHHGVNHTAPVLGRGMEGESSK